MRSVVVSTCQMDDIYDIEQRNSAQSSVGDLMSYSLTLEFKHSVESKVFDSGSMFALSDTPKLVDRSCSSPFSIEGIVNEPSCARDASSEASRMTSTEPYILGFSKNFLLLHIQASPRFMRLKWHSFGKLCARFASVGYS